MPSLRLKRPRFGCLGRSLRTRTVAIVYRQYKHCSMSRPFLNELPQHRISVYTCLLERRGKMETAQVGTARINMKNQKKRPYRWCNMKCRAWASSRLYLGGRGKSLPTSSYSPTCGWADTNLHALSKYTPHGGSTRTGPYKKAQFVVVHCRCRGGGKWESRPETAPEASRIVCVCGWSVMVRTSFH